jgi:hypothetical protein
MSDTFIGKIVILGLTFMLVLILLFSGFGKQSQKVYDCSIAEFHPDYPIKIKEECRRLKYQDNQKKIEA